MAEVFISYSHADTELAHKLAVDLIRAEHKTWIDFSGLVGGQQWISDIESGIQKSDFFLLMLSKNSVNSQWVERETLFALNSGKSIIVLLCDDTSIPLHLGLCSLVDIRQNYGQALSALCGLLALPFGKQTLQHFRKSTSNALTSSREHRNLSRFNKPVAAFLVGMASIAWITLGILQRLGIPSDSDPVATIAGTVSLMGGFIGYTYLREQSWKKLLTVLIIATFIMLILSAGTFE